MAISRLTGQDAKGTSATTSVVATYASTPTVGNTMIASVYTNVGIGLESITGWTSIIAGAFSGVAQSVTIWARVVQAGDGTTVTCSGATGATIMDMHIYEYSGLTTTITTDGTTNATSGVTSVSTLASGNITTTNANDLLFMALATGGSTTSHAFTGGFNIRQSDAVAIRLVDADQIVAATGTYGSTPTWTTAVRAGIVFATFKAASTPSVSFGSTSLMMGV